MNRFFLVIILATAAFFTNQQFSMAICAQTGNTADGGNIIDCPGPVQSTPLNPGSSPATTTLADEVNVLPGGGINTSDDTAIFTSLGDDVINVMGEVSSTAGNGVLTSVGNDTVIVDGGSIMSTTNTAINTASQDDTVIVNGGNINGFQGAILLGSGNDTATIKGGTLTSFSFNLINSASGNDTVTINGGIFIPDEVSVFLGDDDDTLRLGGDVDLGGIIDCGEDFDTIIFAMTVPEQFIPEVSQRITTAGLPNGNIIINGIFYEWENCELLTNELVPGNTGRVAPIPTLSQWGLIAMAGVIGIVGLITVRKRAAAS